ncbi:MAG: hypothetical protein KAR32_13425 [Candidatus Omnitrophica bacterium]|nr:hypothetical protein [Candidatus Omnitrophota bacterium]
MEENSREQLLKELEELKKDQDLVVQSEKLASLAKLISNLAHEINNSLMVISGSAELSLMNELEKGIEKNLKKISEQCNRIKDMIRKLLIFSNPAKGQMNAADINEVIDSAIKSAENDVTSKNIQITRNLASSLPQIEINEKQIRDVFINLIQNSAEAMVEGGCLTISTSVEDNHIRIEFKDTGCGIPQEDIKKVFEPFFTTKDKGAGLGLSVCYGIVKVHEGQLRYESISGQGTTATLILPIPIGSNA